MNGSPFPADADGDALQRIADDGSDMSKPMSIDFFVAVPDEETGQHVARDARAIGYESDVSQDEVSEEWTCYCTKTMLATYANIIAAQDELAEIAEPFGGETDGWGTFGNIDE